MLDPAVDQTEPVTVDMLVTKIRRSPYRLGFHHSNICNEAEDLSIYDFQPQVEPELLCYYHASKPTPGQVLRSQDLENSTPTRSNQSKRESKQRYEVEQSAFLVHL